MASFLKTMVSLCGDAAGVYFSAKKKGPEARKTLEKILDLNQDVPIEDFLKMYDMRIYDMNSQQNDIKFMKSVDFEGVYILRNQTKNKCYVGKASKVFKKIERHFKGYGNEEIYTDWKNGNKFYVNIVKFETSDFENINLLEKDIKLRYKV